MLVFFCLKSFLLHLSYMKLSILICTLAPIFRSTKYITRLLNQLTSQQKGRNIEILYLGDNKSMTVGKKRNILLEIARGERVIFVDDDDLVYDGYIDKLLQYCELDYDCISIGVRHTRDGNGEAIYDFNFKKNINFRDHNEGGRRKHGRMPNHLCLWKKEIAMRVKFPDKNLGEDHDWSEAQILKGYTFFDTKEILYHYDFKSENTQTRIR